LRLRDYELGDYKGLRADEASALPVQKLCFERKTWATSGR